MPIKTLKIYSLVNASRFFIKPNLTVFLYLASFIVALIVLLPVAYLVLRTSGAEGEVLEYLFRWRTWETLKRSLLLAISVTLFSAFISLPIGWLLVRTDLPLKRLWAALTTLPIVIPSYVGGFAVVAALGPKGLIQQLLAPLGIERLPDIYGFTGAFLTLTMLRFPYMLLPIRASLLSIDPSLEEAAKSLGKGTRETFIRVILPQLRPAIATGCLLTALAALSDFGAVSLLRYETFTWAIFLQYQSTFDRTAAAVLSLVLVAIAFAFLILEGRTRTPLSFYRTNQGKRPMLPPIPLGKWQVPALAFIIVVTLISLGMPTYVLCYWLARVIKAGEHFPYLWGTIINSFYISSIAAVITLFAGFPIAYLSTRYPSRIVSILERITYMGFALPGIVVALALVFFGVRHLTPIYQTHALLVTAYVILFLPVSVGSLRALLLQVNPRLEEVALSLGRNRSEIMTRVTIPLVRPGIAAGAALTFLLTIRELPATLILSPIGFKTLATSIWSATSEAFFAQAAVYSIVLIITASLPILFLILKEQR